MMITAAGLAVTQKICDLSRDEFHRVFVAGLCQTLEFGHLVSAGAADLSEKEKKKIVEAISRFVPEDSKLSDHDLDVIAWDITSRSVLLR